MFSANACGIRTKHQLAIPTFLCYFRACFKTPTEPMTLRSRSRVLGQALAILVFHQARKPKFASRTADCKQPMLYPCHQVYLTT